MELIKKYEIALAKANKTESLHCHVLNIEHKLTLLKQQDYTPTVLDEVWINYFLS